MAENITNRLGFLISAEEMRRLSVRVAKSGRIHIEVDLHGYSRKEAKRMLKNIIGLLRGFSFELEVIHGYNGGTAIKDMILTDFNDPRVSRKKAAYRNPGETYLDIVA